MGCPGGCKACVVPVPNSSELLARAGARALRAPRLQAFVPFGSGGVNKITPARQGASTHLLPALGTGAHPTPAQPREQSGGDCLRWAVREDFSLQ